MSRLIDGFASQYDEHEVHRIRIQAAPEVVWRALWDLDLFGSGIVKALLAVRSLPKRIRSVGSEASVRRPPRRLTLADLESAGFGRLAESPEGAATCEVVFGVEGRFWRPVDNLSPFRREAFDGAPPEGTCHAYWNFTVRPLEEGATELATETRIRAGDAASRRKFRLYWLFVRPFSGLVRLRMLRAVRRQAALAAVEGRSTE